MIEKQYIMNNQTIFILCLTAIALCALIFYPKVKIIFGKTGLQVEGSEEKKTSTVKGSKRVELEQTGLSETNVEDSEDVKIKHN